MPQLKPTSKTTMEAINYCEFCNDMMTIFDKVNNEHTPVMITRPNGKPAVVISFDDFKSYEETAYLMASPKNAARLNQAIAEVEAGKTVQHELIEE